MTALSTAPATPEAALKQSGWRPVHAKTGVFGLKTPKGQVLLTPTAAGSSWRSWVVNGKCLLAGEPLVRLKKLGRMSANNNLPGPGKFTRDDDGRTVLRVDLPKGIIRTDPQICFETGRVSSPLADWSEHITAAVMGRDPNSNSANISASFKPAEVAADLEKAGWVASTDGGNVKVTIPMPSMFKEITLGPRESGSQKNSEFQIVTELVRLAGWNAESRAAALRFAEEANRRLRLVRFVLAGEAGDERILAEARLSALGLGVWLDFVLDVLRTTVALCVRPLAALKDPGTAALFPAERSA